jgi:hypothetical protein
MNGKKKMTKVKTFKKEIFHKIFQVVASRRLQFIARRKQNMVPLPYAKEEKSYSKSD